MTKVEEKQKTRLEKLLGMYNAIAEMVQEEVRRNTVEREYRIGRMTKNAFGAKPEDRMVPYVESQVVEPEQFFSFMFGAEHDVVGAGIPGIPETFVKEFGIERPFALQHLVIEDEDAPRFGVQGIFVGSRMIIPGTSLDLIPATRFAASVDPRPLFKKWNIARDGALITVVVKNVSSEPHIFRAKVIGREVVVPETTEIDLFATEVDDAR